VRGWLASSSIYLRGSTALGTTVKPIGRNEYDVDLVCHIPGLARWLRPALCKQLVGDRLKESQRYRAILEEKPRCWRPNYANEFHLDITPSIPSEACVNRGELVPDKALRCWKASNPKDYRDAFQRRAELVPQWWRSLGSGASRRRCPTTWVVHAGTLNDTIPGRSTSPGCILTNATCCLRL
jgi:hypothetical protein